MKRFRFVMIAIVLFGIFGATMALAAQSTSPNSSKMSVPRKGTCDNPVLIGETVSFTAQVNADGTARDEVTQGAYFNVPITFILTRYMTPEYYAQKHSALYQLDGTEAGTQLDITLGAVGGLKSISIQDALLVAYEDADGQMVGGYKLTNAEIGGESVSVIQTGESGTVFKRFSYDENVTIKYLLLIYYFDGRENCVYFSLDEPAAGESASEAVISPLMSGVGSDAKLTNGSTVCGGY